MRERRWRIGWALWGIPTSHTIGPGLGDVSVDWQNGRGQTGDDWAHSPSARRPTRKVGGAFLRAIGGESEVAELARGDGGS